MCMRPQKFILQLLGITLSEYAIPTLVWRERHIQLHYSMFMCCIYMCGAYVMVNEWYCGHSTLTWDCGFQLSRNLAVATWSLSLLTQLAGVRPLWMHVLISPTAIPRDESHPTSTDYLVLLTSSAPFQGEASRFGYGLYRRPRAGLSPRPTM